MIPTHLIHIICIASKILTRHISISSFLVYVKEEHRQKGVGRRLYSYCVKQAADAKCRVFDFVVLKWNTTALNVYKTFGITPRDGDDWHLMRMDATDIDKFMTNRYIE